MEYELSSDFVEQKVKLAGEKGDFYLAASHLIVFKNRNGKR